MNSSIRRDQLMEVASTQSGLDDFGDSDFHEPLDALVESLNREARLEGAQLDAVQGTLVSLLVKRLSVAAHRAASPPSPMKRSSPQSS